MERTISYEFLEIIRKYGEDVETLCSVGVFAVVSVRISTCDRFLFNVRTWKLLILLSYFFSELMISLPIDDQPHRATENTLNAHCPIRCVYLHRSKSQEYIFTQSDDIVRLMFYYQVPSFVVVVSEAQKPRSLPWVDGWGLSPSKTRPPSRARYRLILVSRGDHPSRHGLL